MKPMVHLLLVLVLLPCSVLAARSAAAPQPARDASAEEYKENIFLNFTVDAQPFLNKVGQLIASHLLPVDGCDIPQRSIAFSYANKHVFDFILLQRSAMDAHGMRSCIEKRFITICLDAKCLQMCGDHNITNCVALNLPPVPYTQHSSYKNKYTKNSYSFVTWLKHELMLKSFSLVDEVMYFDADVLVLNNPWPETRFGRDERGKKVEQTYDIMYQRERGIGYVNCGGSANSGVVWVRNSSAVREVYAPAMFAVREDIMEDRVLDQDIMGQNASKKPLRYCTLPARKFFAHCVWSHDRSAPLSETITYHTTCLSGKGTKLRYLKLVLSKANSKELVGAVV